MMFRVRLLLMALLLSLAVGMAAAAAATAEAGPYWHQRTEGKGSGTKIEQSKPVTYSGQGKVKLVFFALKIPVVLEGEIQMKGGIWNGANQGQMKAQVKFNQMGPPEEPACTSETKVPEDYRGYLVWEWNGQTKQLKESSQAKQQKWNVMLIPEQTKLGEKGLSGKNILATISFGANCGIFSDRTESLKGAMFFGTGAGLEEFHNHPVFTGALPVTFVPYDTHYWNGKESVGLEENLFYETFRSSLGGNVPMKFGQEIAVFEK